MAHPPDPGEEFVAPGRVVGSGAQDHQIRAQSRRVVPGQPARVQTALPQGRDHARIVARPRQNDAGMKDVRAS
ncbi:hypothetical protein A5730_02300 [Mycobacterium sp. ACS4054]|nr:hypothetical protein A5730_02300 [Mycobacterium sp. ACS4054]